MEQQLEFSHFTKEDKFEIGNRIHALRTRKGMTLDQLSGLTGIDPRVISRHENGQLCGVEMLIRYALVFGTSLEDLLPVRIACRIKDVTEKDEICSRKVNMLTGEQRQAVFHIVSVMVPPDSIAHESA